MRTSMRVDRLSRTLHFVKLSWRMLTNTALAQNGLPIPTPEEPPREVVGAVGDDTKESKFQKFLQLVLYHLSTDGYKR